MRPDFTRSDIEKMILEYLLANPEARDDLEGIADWWLMKQYISDSVDMLSEMIDELVSKGYVCVSNIGTSKIVYAMNPEKQDEIRSMVRQYDGQLCD